MSRTTKARSSSVGLAALLAAALAGGALTAAPAAAAGAHTTSVTKTNAAVPAPRFLSAVQASLRARQSGKPVVASALTTPTAQTVANPNGTLTLTQTATPTRVFQHGAWANLNGTLKANPDGTFSPAATNDQVVLSGGGHGPLAQMYSGGEGFTLTLPIALPRPTVSGHQATYAGVIPGVDLTVTVTDAGAVSDVFTVHNAAAAHDPRLAQLLDATTAPTRGLHMAADKAGNLAVADAKGRPLFTALVPTAWDSAKTPLPKAAVRDGDPIDPFSTADTLGHGSHRSHLGVTAAAGHLKLTTPAALTGTGTVYPLFIDPTYSPSYPVGNNGWSSPGSGVATQNFWNGTVDYGVGDSDAEVGNSGDVQGEAMSIFNLPVPLGLKGAHIYSANFGITENYSWACLTSGHNQAVDLYAPTQTLTGGTNSNATWNDWVNNLGSQVGQESYALGYDSSCPGNGVPAYPLSTSLVTNDINAGTKLQTFVLRADDHTDNYAFKEFTPSSAQWTVTYDFPPNTPTHLSTVPSVNCNGSTLGDTSVTLYAPASTPTRSTLTTTFSLYKTSDSSKTNLLTTANGVASNTWTGASGQSAVLALQESFFKTQSGGSATEFSFIAQSTDGTLTSAWSAPCSFTWDPTLPGAPGVATTSPADTGDQSCQTTQPSSAGSVQQIGSTCEFTLTPPTTNSAADTITAYVYQVNQAPPVQVPATSPTKIQVPLTRLVNSLTVSAITSGGNVGAPTPVWFDGTAISPAEKDGDLTLDGTPDLIVSGGSGTAFPSGLWLAAGNTDGTVAANAVNIGTSGLSFNSNPNAGDWNGSLPITGDFCGNGTRDVMAYFPTGANAGGAAIACSDGSANPLHLGLGQDTAPYSMGPNTFVDDNSNIATQVVNGGNTSGKGTGIPDLLATAGNKLMVYWSTTPNAYSDPGSCAYGGCYTLSNLNSPDGTADWNSWTIATAQLSSGTAMYLWKSSTGELDLWTGLNVDSTHTTLTTTGQYKISTSFNPGASLLLRAADFSGSGIPGLWATNPASTGTGAGATTAYLPSALANNPTLTSAATTVATATHAWNFQDMPTGTVSNTTVINPTADTGNAATLLPLTGTTGANWNTGDTFDPDAILNTKSDGINPSGSGSTGSLATSGQVLTLTNSFTVSVWADPTTYGGAVFSQDGAAGKNNSGILLTDSTSGWQFSLNTGDGTSWSFDSVWGGTVQLGAWSHITATFDASSKIMSLYVDGTLVGATHHAVPSAGATGSFQVGNEDYSGTRTAYFTGRVADISTWDGAAVAPVQNTSPASYHQSITPTRILDTRYSNQLGSATNTVGTLTAGTATVPGGSTTSVQIAGYGPVTPAASGGPTTIPHSVTAVAVDITATNESGASQVSAYADGTQEPLTSSTNFTANDTVTGYQIVPVGSDGRIAVHLDGSGYNAALIVDITGYFTSDSTLPGDQTYTPLANATRALDTRSSVANTNLTSGEYNASTGAVNDGVAFTLGFSPSVVPSNATAVAVNLTAANETGSGNLWAYATGSTPTTGTTQLSFNTSSPLASLAADVPLSSAGGTITIAVHGTATAVIADVTGYYTTGTSGQTYHTVNPTRLVDTRNGLGGTGGTIAPLASFGTYTLSQNSVRQITTAITPTLAAQVTVTNTSGGPGSMTVWPSANTKPGTTNLNWSAGGTVANLTLTPASTSGSISLYNNSYGTVDFIVDCSGYFN